MSEQDFRVGDIQRSRELENDAQEDLANPDLDRTQVYTPKIPGRTEGDEVPATLPTTHEAVSRRRRNQERFARTQQRFESKLLEFTASARAQASSQADLRHYTSQNPPRPVAQRTVSATNVARVPRPPSGRSYHMKPPYAYSDSEAHTQSMVPYSALGSPPLWMQGQEVWGRPSSTSSAGNPDPTKLWNPEAGPHPPGDYSYYDHMHPYKIEPSSPSADSTGTKSTGPSTAIGAHSERVTKGGGGRRTRKHRTRSSVDWRGFNLPVSAGPGTRRFTATIGGSSPPDRGSSSSSMAPYAHYSQMQPMQYEAQRPPVPPGGWFWGLFDESDSEGTGHYCEIPIAVCQPPLSTIVPPFPISLSGDPPPRVKKRSKYTPEQDELIVRLKSQGNKRWAEIAKAAKCENSLAARNRYQVLIGQQGGSSFLWTQAECVVLHALFDECERAKWYHIADALSKKRGKHCTLAMVHHKVAEMFASNPEQFGVFRTRDSFRGGAPRVRREMYHR